MAIHESDTQKQATDWPLRRSTQLTTGLIGAIKQGPTLQPHSKIYIDLHSSPTRPPAPTSHNRRFQTTLIFGLFYRMTHMKEGNKNKKDKKKSSHGAERPSTSRLSSRHHSHSQATNRFWLQSGSAFFEVALLWAGLSEHLTRHLSHLRVR